MNEADHEILNFFISTRENTIAMLDAVDDEMLSLTPEGEDHNLAWQFAHIASGVNWWMQHVMKDGRGLVDDYPTAKNAIVDKLTASRDRLLEFFTAGDGEAMSRQFSFPMGDDGMTEWIGRERVLYLTAHELHHLGRAELALWQFGITDLPGFP